MWGLCVLFSGLYQNEATQFINQTLSRLFYRIKCVEATKHYVLNMQKHNTRLMANFQDNLGRLVWYRNVKPFSIVLQQEIMVC